MTRDEDDEALSWAGDRDATHVDTPLRAKVAKARTSRQASGSRGSRGGEANGNPASDSDAEAANSESDVAEALAPPTSAALLVTIGILAGIYLLYTIGWVITVQHSGTLAVTPLEQIAITLKEYLAIAACTLWFAAVYYLTRGRTPIVRLVWLAIGAVVLIPWPFVLGIANVR